MNQSLLACSLAALGPKLLGYKRILESHQRTVLPSIRIYDLLINKNISQVLNVLVIESSGSLLTFN